MQSSEEALSTGKCGPQTERRHDPGQWWCRVHNLCPVPVFKALFLSGCVCLLHIKCRLLMEMLPELPLCRGGKLRHSKQRKWIRTLYPPEQAFFWELSVASHLLSAPLAASGFPGPWEPVCKETGTRCSSVINKSQNVPESSDSEAIVGRRNRWLLIKAGGRSN